MAFIISKSSNRHGKNRKLYYLVENYRDGNKVKRETLLKLNECKNLSELLEFVEREEADAIRRFNRNKADLEAFILHRKVPVLMGYRHTSQIKRNLTMWVDLAKADVEKWQNYKAQVKCYM